MKTIKNSILLISSIVILSACSLDQEHEISGAYANIKQIQILDPMAAENNAGVVNSLDGNVGKKVIKGYQETTYSPKEGRVVAAFDGGSE